MPLWSENRRRQSLSRSNDSLRFRHRPYAFDTSSVVSLRSSSCQSPDLVLPRPFPSVLTTRAFDHSRRRWFGTCSCQPVPRGLPSSICRSKVEMSAFSKSTWRGQFLEIAPEQYCHSPHHSALSHRGLVQS